MFFLLQIVDSLHNLAHSPLSVKILDSESHWFERGVNQALYIHINQPTLGSSYFSAWADFHWNH